MRSPRMAGGLGRGQGRRLYRRGEGGGEHEREREREREDSEGDRGGTCIGAGKVAENMSVCRASRPGMSRFCTTCVCSFVCLRAAAQPGMLRSRTACGLKQRHPRCPPPPPTAALRYAAVELKISFIAGGVGSRCGGPSAPAGVLLRHVAADIWGGGGGDERPASISLSLASGVSASVRNLLLLPSDIRPPDPVPSYRTPSLSASALHSPYPDLPSPPPPSPAPGVSAARSPCPASGPPRREPAPDYICRQIRL